jgi:hypothetical protein
MLREKVKTRNTENVITHVLVQHKKAVRCKYGVIQDVMAALRCILRDGLYSSLLACGKWTVERQAKGRDCPAS